MKKIAHLIILGSQALLFQAAGASELDVAIASQMAAAEVTQLQEARGKMWSLGVTRNGEVDATALWVAFNVVGDVRAVPRLRSGLGWKAVAHDTFQRAISLAVGGSFRYEPEQLPGIGFESQLYFAPQVLNTNDADRYHELLARVTYDLHAQANVFAGWMDKTVRYTDNAPMQKVEINHAFTIGFRLNF